MTQLLEMAVDEVKIDTSFAFALGSDRRAAAVVRAAVELGRALGLTVVAEGIEDRGALRLLQRLGADIGQGYVIARPLTPDQLDEYLAGAADRAPGFLRLPAGEGATPRRRLNRPPLTTAGVARLLVGFCAPLRWPRWLSPYRKARSPTSPASLASPSATTSSNCTRRSSPASSAMPPT